MLLLLMVLLITIEGDDVGAGCAIRVQHASASRLEVDGNNSIIIIIITNSLTLISVLMLLLLMLRPPSLLIVE